MFSLPIFSFLWFLTDSLPVSSAHAHPHQRGREGGDWSFLFPPPPRSRPVPRQPHYPHPPYHHSNTYHHYPPHATPLTADPLPSFSAQTHNVLSVPRPSPYPIGNSPGSFPVNVIPYENSTYHLEDTKIHNPLRQNGEAGTHHNSSRAGRILNGLRNVSEPQKTSTYI